MLLIRYLWLLLCYAQYARSNLLDEYEDINNILSPSEESAIALPIELERDSKSGCLCRASKNYKHVVCFGNYACRRFPQVNVKCEQLIVRTTATTMILVGELTGTELKVLRIEANHQLIYLEPGLFQNLTKLQQLSISYNTVLHTLHEKTFEGLINLKNLTLVNNGFTDILQLTPAFKPTILPSLKRLDLSENSFEVITQDAFKPMVGSTLIRLDLKICALDDIHPNSFLPLQMLKKLYLSTNDLNSTLIENFLEMMMSNNITLTHLDLSGMGFRKQPPQKLMEVIAQSTIKCLILAENQFEIITDQSFPAMTNLEVMDLRKCSAISISQNVFGPARFPKLRVLLLSGNFLPGIHHKHITNSQVLLLDLSYNRGSISSPIPMYYEIDKDAFIHCKNLEILNLAYDRIKTIYNYTFQGLQNLKVLSLENSTLFYIGNGTFRPLNKLKMLNLANNPLTVAQNITQYIFKGLNELNILILTNCGIKRFNENDNIFEMMPQLTHLILKNNQLYYITAEILKPMKDLQVLDLSENLLAAWSRPMFLNSGVHPQNLYLMNNKISHFTVSMVEDIDYLFGNNKNLSIDINLMDNVFICDCSSMYKTYMWLQVNGSVLLHNYFTTSTFECRSPDVWENHRVIDYLSSIKSLRCLMFKKITNLLLLIWTAPCIVTGILIMATLWTVYKYKTYIRYWAFLVKVAIARKFSQKSRSENTHVKGFKYDAFISYCNQDRDFVSEIVSQLENNPPNLKLCVYERDFEIGSFISESVLNSINESKYVILIISNSFAKSQWCRWETQLAEYHRLFLEDGTAYDPLILIRIGDIESKYLTTTLKYLLKTKIYLTWDEHQSEEFWIKLRQALV